MKNFIILSSFVLLFSGCDATTPVSTPTPMVSVDPRCSATPTPGLDRMGIICPGGTTGGSTMSPSMVPTTNPPTSPVTTSPISSFSPRPAVNASDIACLSGRWYQSSSELNFQYFQSIPTVPVLVEPDSTIDFNFTRTGNSGTFTQTFNNVVLTSSRTSALSRGGVDNYKFTFNGTAAGSFQKNDDGKIYFYDVRPEGVTMQIEVNGQQMLSDPNLTGDMLPVYATEVGVSCGSALKLTYKIPSRNVTIYLDRR